MVGCTTWYLLLNHQQIPVFLTATIVALGFVGTMILLPKYRQQLVKRIVAYHARSKEQRGLYRYQKLALVITTTNILIYPIATTLPPSQYIPYFLLTFLIVQLTAGSVVIAFLMLITVSVGILAISFWRVIGKWVLLLIVVAVAVGILRALMWILMQT